MTATSPIVMRDDFAVVCDNPFRAGIFVPALKTLATSLSERSTVSLMKRRASRSILVGGDRRARTRVLLRGRILPGDRHIRLTPTDTMMWWNHDGQEWSIRAAMRDDHVIPSRSASAVSALQIIELTTATMIRLTDPDERVRGEAVAASLKAWARSAASQVPGSRVACPAPPGPLGPETGRRALSGREHDHVSTPVLDERVARSVPPSLHVWINHVWHPTGVPSHHVTISGAFGVAGCPESPMARLRAMSSIPVGETWAMPS